MIERRRSLAESARLMQLAPARPAYEIDVLQILRDAVEAQSQRAMELARAAGLPLPDRRPS